MTFLDLAECDVNEPFPGFKGRFVHSEHMTFVHWDITAGATLPDHAHPHEQVVNMLEGRFELTILGETRTLGPASVAVIPANARHSGKAIRACRIIDVFYPVREDYQ